MLQTYRVLSRAPFKQSSYMKIQRRLLFSFLQDRSIPASRRASRVCNSLITAHSDEEITIYDSALTDTISMIKHPFEKIDLYLDNHPNFVMGNVLCALSAIITGIKDEETYVQRLQDTLSHDSSKKDFTKNEHLYGDVISSLLCNRVYYAINTLESILMNDPTDILAIHTLSSLYPMVGNSQGMYSSISRTWSYWGMNVACDELMAGYRAQTLVDLGFVNDGESAAMHALSGLRNDIRSIHAVSHACEIRGRTREGIRFLRETQKEWTNESVDYRTGSINEHHLKSHLWSLFLQIHQCEHAIALIDETLGRDVDVSKGEVKDMWSTGQDLLCDSHVNDYVNVMYRLELMGEGMGERWERVGGLVKKNKRVLMTPFDRIYRGILYSVTGEEEKLRDMMMMKKEEEKEEMWRQFDLPHTSVKWVSMKGNDRVNAMSENSLVTPVIESILKLNSEKYNETADDMFSLIPRLSELGGEERDRELLLLATYKALDGAGRYVILERMLNEFTTMNAKRADCFYLLSDCLKKMGHLKKAETLLDYARTLGYEQGGKNSS